MPTAKTGHGNQPGSPPLISDGAFAVKLPTTSNPPATAPRAWPALTLGRLPRLARRAAANPNPLRQALTATGAHTGPAHGTGIKKRTSHVFGE
jgi:hypothetical protein